MPLPIPGGVGNTLEVRMLTELEFYAVVVLFVVSLVSLLITLGFQIYSYVKERRDESGLSNFG